MEALKVSFILWILLNLNDTSSSEPPEPHLRRSNAGQLGPVKRGRSSTPEDSSLDWWWSLYDSVFTSHAPYKRDNPALWSSDHNNLAEVQGKEILDLGKMSKLSQGPRRRRHLDQKITKIFTFDPLFGIPIVVTKRPELKDRASKPPSRSFLKLEDLELLERSLEVQENVLPPPVVEKTAESKFLSMEKVEPSLLQEKETLLNRTWRPYSPKFIGNQLQRRCLFEGMGHIQLNRL